MVNVRPLTQTEIIYEFHLHGFNISVDFKCLLMFCLGMKSVTSGSDEGSIFACFTFKTCLKFHSQAVELKTKGDWKGLKMISDILNQLSRQRQQEAVQYAKRQLYFHAQISDGIKFSKFHSKNKISLLFFFFFY